MCIQIGPPGLKLRSSILSILASSTVLPARPPRMAWYTFSGSTPAFSANTMASATAERCRATIIWFASLQVLPLPMSPTRVTASPMALNTSSTESNTSFFPPTMIDIVPSMALGSPPLTGASSISTPFCATISQSFFETTGEMELMSMNMEPGRTVSRIPLGPQPTPST